MKVSILKLRQVLIASVQIDLTDEEAIQFRSDLLEKIAKTNAFGVVLDITALDIVDSYMARIINDTATMAGILGADVIVCGMQPSVALTLIEMGRELIGVETALNLNSAVEDLEKRINDRLSDYAYEVDEDL